MNIQNSKKSIMGLAALMIMFFHLWIPLFGYGTAVGQLERFLVAIGYVGVDMFFFVSAYTMAKNPPENYWRFIGNRALKLMPLFLIALACGQFLWFIPALMVTYLAFPPILKQVEKYPRLSLLAVPAGWLALTALVLGLVNKSQDLGIFLFRIPIIILGAWAAKLDARRGAFSSSAHGVVAGDRHTASSTRFAGPLSAKTRLILGVLLTIAGTLISFRYGYTDKLGFPFRDAFYLTGIPLTLGLILLLDSINDLPARSPRRFTGFVDKPTNTAARMPVNASDKTVLVSKHSHRWRFAPLAFLGGISLELYFSQVVFGSWIVNSILGLTHSRIFTNFVSFAFTILVAYAIGLAYKFITKRTHEAKHMAQAKS